MGKTTESVAISREEDVPSLQHLQERFVLFFARLAQKFGMPRSLGHLYGILFAAPRPMAFDEIVTSSGLSKGAVSQGLRTLTKMKAIDSSFLPNDRRTFYEVETSVRKLVGAFLDETIKPVLEENEQELDRLTGEVNEIEELESAELELLTRRLESLKVWHEKATQLLPLLSSASMPPES